MSSSNTAYVDRTSDSSRIWMDVTDPHVIGAELIASDSSLSRDIDRPDYQLALADETITLQFETSERVETPSSLTINGQSMITVSSQSGDTTGKKWEAVTSVSGLSSDSEVSFVIAGFEDPSGNPMSSSNTTYVDRTSDNSRIWMDVTDPHVTSAVLVASDSSLSRDIDRPGYQLALADETITLQFETSERVETPSSLTINGQSMITVSSQSGDTTGMKWEAVTSVSGLSSDSEVSFVIAGFEDPSGNPMSSSNTAYVDRTSDSSRIWMDVTDPHVIGAELIASDSSLSRDIDRPGYQLALADETITLQFETSERVETPSSLTINGQSMITVSSQSGDTTGTLWEAVTSVSGLSSDSEVSFVIAGFEDPSGNPMSSSNTAYVDRTSDSSRIWMDVTDPHVIGAELIASNSSLSRDIDRPGYQLALADETITFRFKRASG